MSYSRIDLESQKVPSVTEIPLDTSPTKPPSQLRLYQTLIGDIDAPAPTGRSKARRSSFYHQVVAQESKAKQWYWITGLSFAALVTAQIVFCLSISVGAQLNFSANLISILAAVNTLVAAGIAALKGLGLPEKKALERHKLRKINDRIQYTTRRLQAGLELDAQREAEAIRQMDEECEDQASLFQNVGEAASLVPERAKGVFRRDRVVTA